ncbi:MAG: NAD kinase [Marinirhabdus sp.]
MKIGIFGQFYHQGSETYILQILGALQKENADVYIEEDFFDIINRNGALNKNYKNFSTFEKLDASFNFFFSIGGDGTLLRAVTYVRNLGIPIVGINTGRLGFLASIHKEEIAGSIKKILQNEFSISKRSLVAVSTTPETDEFKKMNFALNEVAINRKNTTSMIKVETFVNGQYLNSYWSDGLIVATPTGSTGYSLSCGGPVIDPSAKNLVITPIAAHNLNARPIVIPDNSTLSLKVSGRENTFMASLDARIATLKNNTAVHIKKAPFYVNLVQLNQDSFIATLRKKLLWGEDKRNRQ